MKRFGLGLGIVSIVVSTATTIVFGVLELKKERRMHKKDVELIVEGVIAGTRRAEEKILEDVKTEEGA